MGRVPCILYLWRLFLIPIGFLGSFLELSEPLWSLMLQSLIVGKLHRVLLFGSLLLPSFGRPPVLKEQEINLVSLIDRFHDEGRCRVP